MRSVFTCFPGACCIVFLLFVARQSHVRRIDTLFCVSSYRLSPSPSTADNCGVFVDTRIVRATGRWVHSDILGKITSFLPYTAIQGKHVRTIPIALIRCYGMAVNASETLLAISVHLLHKLVVYSLPGGTPIMIIGGYGSDPGQFILPRLICFGHGDCLLVIDGYRTYRLQEFGVNGEWRRTIVLDGKAFAVTSSNSGDLIAVGTLTKTIALLDYASGGVLRVIANDALVPGEVRSLCFTPDDAHLMFTTNMDYIISVLKVADGSLVRIVGCGLSHAIYGYVHAWTVTNDYQIVVAHYKQHRVSIWSCTDNGPATVLNREFGRKGTSDGEFKKPTAVAVVGGRLYVLDWGSNRVQVFE